jgi:3-oxoadipate enol-lactonase
MEGHMNFIEVNGAALRYDLSGAGASTLVLVHEMGGTLESWDFVLPMLATKRRVLRYDARGQGLSEKVRGNVTIDTMVADLVALMDALGITGKVALAGMAVGGAIELHTAALFANRVAVLTVSSPSIRIAADRRATVLARAERMEREGLRAILDALDTGYPSELRRDANRFASFRARWLGSDPVSLAAIYRGMLARMDDLYDELSRITCPTLVIAGALDRSRPPQVVEPIARAIPGARFEVHQTGHFAAVQTPELFAGAVNEFLDASGN